MVGRPRGRDGQHYPQVKVDKQHIDILSARFVLQPTRFDVVVASNLFGDILSDLGPACTGTIGLAPSANLNPERNFPSLFEPVHGSAPDIYGQNIANPVAMIWSGALMLDFLGQRGAHDAIVRAIERVLAEGPRTADLGGKAIDERDWQGHRRPDLSGRPSTRLVRTLPCAETPSSLHAGSV